MTDPVNQQSPVPCSSIEEVNARWGHLKHMSPKKASRLRRLIIENDLADLLELGFFHGKSSAFMAAVLEERGKGHLTTIDLRGAVKRDPPYSEVLQSLGLSHRVTPILAHRSFTWELCKMLERKPRPRFDFCYFDGGHLWDPTGFAFLLVDMLLRPGAVVVFDDLDWTIEDSVKNGRKPPLGYGDEEMAAKQVRKVWEILVPERGYTDLQEMKGFQWGVAKKPI